LDDLLGWTTSLEKLALSSDPVLDFQSASMFTVRSSTGTGFCFWCGLQFALVQSQHPNSLGGLELDRRVVGQCAVPVGTLPAQEPKAMQLPDGAHFPPQTTIDKVYLRKGA
jgi:hypothetical protein